MAFTKSADGIAAKGKTNEQMLSLGRNEAKIANQKRG